MANVKISELNPLLTVQDADVLPIVDNGVTKKVTAAILQSYTQGNSVLLTGAQTIAGIKTFTSQLASSVATGTAPFSVASTTKVTNLNADLLDGLSSADFQATLSGTGIVKSTAGTISYLTDNSTNWNTAYNDKINSAAVTGSGTNTLTLTQQDAGTITATWVNGTVIREIRNNTGATLTKGTIVYISGATGNKPTVSKAIATGDSTSAQTFGFVQEDIANNANGYVVVVGDLTGVDTSAFNEGDQLYLSSTTAGAFTSTKQYAPAHLVYVGIVTRSHPTLGQIEVNIQNGYEMDELHNVSAQNPSNGDILQFVTSTGLWTKVAGSTTNISEGTNLYYTAARFNSAFAGKTTTDLTEGTNLYFTNARARGAISLTTSGTSGAATYNSSTGVLNIPNYADTDTGITSLNGLTALTQTFAVGTSGTDFGISSATSTHTFNLPTASATNRGALSSADWTTFNNKQNALTNPITGTGTTNYLPKFTGSTALGDSSIYDNGNIGIGTTSPATKFQVSGGRTSLFSGDAYSIILAQTAAQANLVYLGTQSDGTFNISNNAGNPQLTLTQTGNLGLGTTTPQTKLVVNGAGYSFITGFTTNNRSVAIGLDSSYEPSIQGTLTDGTARQISINPAGGNVGIGTYAPTNGKLVVKDSGFQYIAEPTDATTYGYLGIGHFANGSFIGSYAGSNSVSDILRFGTGGSERMRITSAGNVGIGTTTPDVFGRGYSGTILGISSAGQSAIQLNSATGNGAYFDMGVAGTRTFNIYSDSGSTDIAAVGNRSLGLSTNGNNRIFISGNGNVGVNTNGVDAGYKLDVNGTARVGGQLNASTIYVNSTEYTYSNYVTQVIGPRPAADGIANLWLRPSDASANVGFSITATNSIFQIGNLVSDPFFTINYSSGAATFSSSVTVSSGGGTNGRLGVRGTTNDSSAYAFEAANSSGSTLFIVRNDGITSVDGKLLVGTFTPGGSPLKVVGLPTSPAGLSTGDVWNNLGILTIV